MQSGGKPLRLQLAVLRFEFMPGGDFLRCGGKLSRVLGPKPLPQGFLRFGRRGRWPGGSGGCTARKQANQRQKRSERSLLYGQFPDLGTALLIDGDDAALVGKKSCPGQSGEAAQRWRQGLAALGIPDPHTLVSASCDNPSAVGAEGGAAHLVLVFERPGQLPARGGIPHDGSEVGACGDDPATVAAESHGKNAGRVI